MSRPRSHSQAHSQKSTNSRTQDPRSRAASNPWSRYADFFINRSFLIPDTIAFAKILPFFKALPNYSLNYRIVLVELIGYEAYFVEQWISSRSPNTLIVTYTGDQNDRIIAYHVQLLSSNTLLSQPPPIHEPTKNILQIPANESIAAFQNWPPKFISYLVEQLESPFCVATETSLGYAFITNLAQLNPFLSLIDAKTGNIEDDYQLYVVNYNLRKLGCGSRSAATTDEPSKSMEGKFKTTFKIDTKIPINYAVVNIISIIQNFLYYYGLLEAVYCDGLLCEKTESAIDEWWKIVSEIPIAMHIIKVKPPSAHTSDSILAIIGFTVLCRYLLELGGNNFNVPKDPNDIKKMKASILKFQKHFKLEPTATFDLETLSKLFEYGQNIKATQNLTKDLSKVKKLVKNTVIDITSGKNLQSIAQNANASPFRLHSHSNYDDNKLINCQDIDQIKHMSLGRQLSYLFFNSGKQINLEKESLAFQAIKKIADSTSSGSIIDGVKRLRSTIGGTINPQKSMNAFSELKNFSTATLNIFDKDHEMGISDSETTNEVERSKVGSDIEPDKIVSDVNKYYDDSNINKKIKGNKRYANSINMSSDDEAGRIEHFRKDSLAAYDFDDYPDDVAIYNPSKKSGIMKSKNNNSRANSVGVVPDPWYDNSAEYDGYDAIEFQDNLNNHTAKDRGSSFSSRFKFSRRVNSDNNNMHEALIDDEILSDSDYNKSYPNSRRDTEGRDGKPLISIYASPHVISTADFSEPTTRLNSFDKPSTESSLVEKPNQHNESSQLSSNGNDSDGVYEYENGFDYDYEFDGTNNSNTHNRKHSSLNSSKEHLRKPSGTNIPKSSNFISPSKTEIQNYTPFSTQSNLASMNYKNSDLDKFRDHPDVDYLQFMKRIKRRHSIPIVEHEMNKYSIEMKTKMYKLDRETTSTMEKRRSWLTNNRSIWDVPYRNINHGNAGSFSNETSKLNDNENNDVAENDERALSRSRNQSGYRSKSRYPSSNWDSHYVSMDSFILYQKHLENNPLRRCESFSVLENSLVNEGKSSDVYGFEFSDRQFLTPEVLAMKYLKLKAKYQFEMVQRSYFLTKNLKAYSKYILDCSNIVKNPGTCISLKYNTTKGDINKAIGKYYELEEKVKNTTKNNARLKYELRLLLQKTKEVENNLKTLRDFKIKTLGEKIDSLSKGLSSIEQYSLSDHSTEPSTNKNESSNAIEMIYRDDDLINWKDISLKDVVHNPKLLIYLCFHLILCKVLHRVDSKFLETKWKQIDKNETVTMTFKKLYSIANEGLAKGDLVKLETRKDK
jgi:hypothetical protein